MIIRSFLALVLVFIGTRSSVAIDYPHIPSQPIDMDRDGRSDFYLLRLLYLNNAPTWVRQETLRLGTYDLFQTPEERLESPNGNSARVQDGQIALLSAGDIVGDAPHASQRWVDAFVPPYISVDNSLAFQAPGAWEGLWGAAREGFAGVRIAADDGVHYGWIKLRVENWNEETPNSIRLNGPLATDWYLESRPNTPIVAGAVPEPASVVLIFVSIACIVGLLRRRLVRRRGRNTCFVFDGAYRGPGGSTGSRVDRAEWQRWRRRMAYTVELESGCGAQQRQRRQQRRCGGHL